VTDKEWREASDMRPSINGLALVLVVAAVLRFWSLGYGIPFAIGVDEPEIMVRVVTMLKTGSFNPHFFDYPGLTFYLQVPVAIARFLLGAILGRWQSLDQVDAGDFYLWARALTALFGTGTVFLTYQIGMRWGARHALLGAGLLAVLPMHVRESHFVLADVPATFFATLTLLLSMVAHEKGTAKAFLWAGVAAGLTIASKYNAGLILLLPLIAAWMTLPARPSRLICMLAALGGSIAAFLIGAPYTLLDLPAFLNGFAHLTAAYRPHAGTSSESGASIYLKHLLNTLGWPAFLLLISGLVLGIVRAVKGPGRVRWTLLVVFPVVYFYTISGRGLIFGRYLLPILPFVCMLAAIAVVSGVSLLRRFDIPRTPRRLLIAALTIAALLPPAWNSVSFDRTISQRSTNELTYNWILMNIPAKSRVVIEKYDLRLSDSLYRLAYVNELTTRQYDDYARDGIDYIVASSQAFGPVLEAPQSAPDRYARYRAIFDQSQQVFAVKPQPGRPGPELRVYRLVRPAPAQAPDAAKPGPATPEPPKP
jgi:4-amino-4-deoxy-L-arabinose transferase-like glycosyltransferase